jgi:hypothetical protein
MRLYLRTEARSGWGTPSRRGEGASTRSRVKRPRCGSQWAHPAAFELSTEEMKDVNPRLSVWAERLTQPRQAWELMDRKPQYRLVYYLAVDGIRSLVPELGIPELPLLDVLWHPKLLATASGEMVRDTRPGADGHAGITGLNRPEQIPRSHYKLLRFRLAEKALVRSLDSLSEEQDDAPGAPTPDVGAANARTRTVSPLIESRGSTAAPGHSARDTTPEEGTRARWGCSDWILRAVAICGLALVIRLLAKVLPRGENLDDAPG